MTFYKSQKSVSIPTKQRQSIDEIIKLMIKKITINILLALNNYKETHASHN